MHNSFMKYAYSEQILVQQNYLTNACRIPIKRRFSHLPERTSLCKAELEEKYRCTLLNVALVHSVQLVAHVLKVPIVC